MSKFVFTISSIQIGSFTGLSINQPVPIVKGEHIIIKAAVKNELGLPHSMSSKTPYLRMKKQDGSNLSVVGTVTSIPDGEMTFTLDATTTSSLKKGGNQDIEIEIRSTSSPNLKTFFKVSRAVHVREQTFP